MNSREFFKESHLKSIDTAKISDYSKTHRQGFFDSIYDLGPELSNVLNALIPAIKPSLFIETGVAAGKSSNVILNLLSENHEGRLLSFDVTEKVGELIDPKNLDLWDLFVLPEIRRKSHFVSKLQSSQEAELFLHDSDHSPKWQKFETEQAIRNLPNLRYILLDDSQGRVAKF